MRGNVAHTVAFHFDAESGSGLGHYNRCLNLARAFAQREVTIYFYLSLDAAMHLKSRGLLDDLPLETVTEPTTTTGSIIEFCDFANVDILVIDNYKFDRNSEAVLRNKVLLVMIDDHLFDHRANIVLNHRPGLSVEEIRHEDETRTLFLGGARFCMATAKSGEGLRPFATPLKILLHAGGSDLYRPFLGFFKAVLSCAVDSRSISVDVLRANIDIRLPDELSNFVDQENNLVNEVSFGVPLREILYRYDVVVGPAGTTTYETLIAGRVPLSFEINEDGRDSKYAWSRLGHLFHLNFSETQDPSVSGRVISLFFENLNRVANLIQQAPTKLDGLGCERAVNDILKYAQMHISSLNWAVSDFATITNQNPTKGFFESCSSSDALDFLESRNSEKARLASTSPDHIISWIDHITWWVDPRIRRYKLFDEAKTSIQGYFWIKQVSVDDAKYFTSGWFPSENFQRDGGLGLGLRIMKAMRKVVSASNMYGLWVITMRADNRFVIKANKRFGFKSAKLHPDLLETLYPGAKQADLISMAQAMPLEPSAV